MNASTFDRPILLLGPTRSGKSMVAALLARLPEFALAFEPLTTWNIGKPWRRDDHRDVTEANEEVIASIRREIVRFLEAEQKPRYVDDLPHHALRVGFCAAVLPEAKFVLVARDGRDAVREMLYGWRYRDTLGQALGRRLGSTSTRRAIKLSRLPGQGLRWGYNWVRIRAGRRRRTWGPTVPGQYEYARGHSLVETVAFQWAEMARRTISGLEQLDADRHLTVRFERIREDPVGESARIAEFCEIDEPRRLADIARAHIETTRPHYTPPLTDEELIQIEPIIRAMQARLGYDGEPEASEEDTP